jgi:hypothetical protein
MKMNISQNKNPVLRSLFLAAFLLLLLATASVRAGTITLNSLPATGTDAATGLSSNNNYRCCIAWGATANVTINGVVFKAVSPTTGVTNASGTDTYGGPWSINCYNTVTTGNQGMGNTTGNETTNANGNTEVLLSKLTYLRGTPGIDSWVALNFGGLVPGGQYALRLYYCQRSGDTGNTNRPLNIAYNGEGTTTNQQYNGNPLNEDAGGAAFIEYDFTAATTSVSMFMTNEYSTESPLIYGTSLQETAPPETFVAPAISTQPVGFTNYAGQTVSLSVGASGAPSPTYQWYQGNSALTGATNFSLVFSPLDPTNAGSYYVVVSNYYAVSNLAGAVTSSVVSVVVLNPITEEPGNVTATNGQTATFWVNAVGATNYQWYSNSGLITGATNAVYTTPNLTMAANNSSYTVTVTTPDGPTNSTTATLTVVADTAPPTVFSATQSTNATATNIVVVYSEAVSAATALNTANYSLNGVTPVSAVAGSQPNVVILAPATALSTNTANFLTIQNVQDLSANTIVTANVPVFPANMSLWLRADAGVMTDVNGNVVEWLDQTANANNATQYSGGPTERPTPQSGAMNGEPALSFNAANTNYLQVATSPSVAITGDITIYAVANFSDYAAAREILGKTKGNIPAPNDYYVLSATSGATLFRGNGSVYGHFAASSVPSLGTQHVLAVMTMSATNVSHFLDGVADGTGILNNTLTASEITDAGLPLDIGSRNDLAQLMNGDIAEVMLFSDAVSPADRTNIDNYLGVKYFPFTITQQPAPVTTNEGGTATFSIAASQGSAHLTYQWQESTTNNPTPANIPGATNASYTTSTLAPGDNGDTFDVLMSVPGGPTNVSSPATLTVNTAPPVVVSAGTAIWSQSQSVVVFSEAVSPATATVAGNYSLSPSGRVLSAVMGGAPNEVVLTTSPLTPGTAYSLTVSNVMDLYNNTIVTASTQTGVYPVSVALWLEGNEGVTVDGNGYVTQWNDQSGNGNDLFQPSGDFYAPLQVTNGINGLPTLQFDGTNDYMYANASSSLAITGDMSVFAVMNFSNLNSAGNTIVSRDQANLADPYDYYVTPSAVKLYRGNGSAYGVAASSRAPSTGVAHVLDVTMQGTAVTHRLDGAANGSGVISTTIGDNGGYLFIGARDDGTNKFQGQLAELIVLGAAASSNDTASIENYLAAKYAILLGSAPMLSVSQSAGKVVLTWTTPTAPFVLEATPTLSGAWTPVTNAALTSGGLSTMTLPASGTQMFYRLQEQ